MKPGDERYRILYELQHKCNELNRKIDSLIRMMEILTTYMQYSSMMAEMTAVQTPGSGSDRGADDGQASFDGTPEGSGRMDPREFQKIMNMAKSSDHPMSEGEFQEIFNTLKQGKSEEEVTRMEQMVKLARSFMK